MVEPTTTEIQARLQDVDPEIRAAMTSDEIITAMRFLKEKYRIDPLTKMNFLSRLVGWVMLELLPLEDFITQLKNVGVRPEEFEQLKKDLVEIVFEPHKLVLQKNGIDYRAILTAQPRISVPVTVSRQTLPPQSVPIARPIVPSAPTASMPQTVSLPVTPAKTTISPVGVRPPERPQPISPQAGPSRITYPQTPPTGSNVLPLTAPQQVPLREIPIKEIRFGTPPKIEETPKMFFPEATKPEAKRVVPIVPTVMPPTPVKPAPRLPETKLVTTVSSAAEEIKPRATSPSAPLPPSLKPSIPTVPVTIPPSPSSTTIAAQVRPQETPSTPKPVVFPPMPSTPTPLDQSPPPKIQLPTETAPYVPAVITPEKSRPESRGAEVIDLSTFEIKKQP